MRQNFFGLIINLSSTSGIRGAPGWDAYTGSKFALEGLTQSLRFSLVPFNVSIVNVNPGPILTNFNSAVHSHTFVLDEEDEKKKGGEEKRISFFREDLDYENDPSLLYLEGKINLIFFFFCINF